MAESKTQLRHPGPTKEAILDWLQTILDLTGWSPSRLASEAGVAPSTVNRFIAGAGHILSTSTVGRIETAASQRIRQRVALGEIPPLGPGSKAEESLVMVDEADARDPTGNGGRDQWGFPETWFRFAFGGPGESDPRRYRVVPVEDEAMWPDFRPGDRVLVDQHECTGSPAGVYLVFDGVAWTPRHLELMPGSSPPSVMLRARNPDYMTREARIDDLRVLGRVVGMWRRV